MSGNIEVIQTVNEGTITATQDTCSITLQPVIVKSSENGGGYWGSITGTLSDQTDLQNDLDEKANTDDLGSAAFTEYTDYATSEQGEKADTATQPDDFKTVGGQSIIGTGDIPVSGTGGVPEAPEDNKLYGRKNATWEEIPSGGGGGAATSVNQGENQTYIGELINDSFDGNSINTDYWGSLALPLGVSVENKLIVDSGISDWSKYIQLSRLYLYETQDFTINFKPLSKNVGDGWGFSQSEILFLYNATTYWKFNQETGVFSMGSTTDANDYLMQPIDFSIGDELKLTLRRRPSQTIVTIENLTDTSKDTALGEFPISKWGTSGNPRLCFLGGQQEFYNFTIDAFVPDFNGEEGVVFVGDSITQGLGSSSVVNRWTNQLMSNQEQDIVNLGVNSWLSGTLTASRLTDILDNINGKYLLCSIGYNDQAQGISLATYQSNLETIATTSQGLGYEVIFVSPYPNLNTSNSGYVLAMSDAALNTSSIFIDVTPQIGDLADINLLYDSIHPNDLGHKQFAEAIKLYSNELSLELLKNYGNSDIVFNGLSYSDETLPILGINSKGKAVKLNPSKYVNEKSVLLQDNLTVDGSVMNLQEGNIGVKGKIKNADSYVQANLKGLQIGFNKNDDGLYTYEGVSNLQIHNFGVGGTGSPQKFYDLSGAGNIILGAASAFIPYGGVTFKDISGINNLIFQTNFTNDLTGDNNVLLGATSSKLTSGKKNIFIGSGSGRNIEEGSGNIILNTSDSNYNYETDLSGAIILGNTVFPDEVAEKGVIIISGDHIANPKMYVGGVKGYGAGDIEWHSKSRIGADRDSNTTVYYGSRGTGTGSANGFLWKVYEPKSTSSSDSHDTTTDALGVENNKIEAYKPIKKAGYIVDTLPSGEIGMEAYVTDALTVTYRGIAVGGGTEVSPVFFDGTNWIYQ